MRYAKIEHNSVANGPGVRVVLWCQGCSLHCKGCHNESTWDPDGGKMFGCHEGGEILEWLKLPWISGLTLSGGHPLEPYNIDMCTELCMEAKEVVRDKTIWLYTGWLWEDIKDLPIMKYIDVIVDGPFIEELKDISLPYSGSKNQRVIDVQKSLQYNTLVLYEAL